MADPSTSHSASRASSSDPGSLDLWRYLWKLDVPNRVKHFAWRVCTDTLPTPENLLRRHVSIESSCPFFGDGDGSLLHTLCTCPRSRQIWALSALPFRIRRDGHASAKLWFRYLLLGTSTSGWDLFVMLTHSIWLSRNKLCFQGILDNPFTVARQAEVILRHFHEANTSQVSACPDRPLPPEAPREGLSIFFDAGFSAETGTACLGSCIVDAGGHFIAGVARKCPNVSDPTTAEAMAACAAMQLASSVGIKGASLYGDSLTIINSIKDEENSYAPFGPLIYEIRQSLSSGVIANVCWIRRLQNMIAHSLAEHIKRRDVSECFWPSRPDFVSQIALDELSNS